MSLYVKANGEAVAEEPKTTAASPTQTTAPTTQANANQTVPAADTGASASPAGNATTGLDYKTIQSGLTTTYDSKYDEQLADLYNQITQRKPFSYSAEDDLLYKMYEEKYTQQGKQAMRDTMGQAAALAGGYGSSYGQTVSQQQYDAHLQKLNDILPELYNMAYQRYNDEGDRLTQQYGLVKDMDARDLDTWLRNYQVNADNYNRLMEQAALLGAAGDFSMYKDIVGDSGAANMQTTYNIDRLLPLLDAGLINSEQLNQLLKPYLESMGITMPEATSSGGNDRAASDILRDQMWQAANAEIKAGGDANQIIADTQAVIKNYRF